MFKLITHTVGKMLKALLLLLLAVVLLLLFVPVVMPCRMLYVLLQRGRLDALRLYFLAIATGIDQLGGAVLYGTEDYTISAYTFKLSMPEDGSKSIYLASLLMRVIDCFFGASHCRNAYYNEVIAFEVLLNETAKKAQVD